MLSGGPVTVEGGGGTCAIRRTCDGGGGNVCYQEDL